MRILIVTYKITLDIASLADALRGEECLVDIFCFETTNSREFHSSFDHVFALDWAGPCSNLVRPFLMLSRRRAWRSGFALLKRMLWKHYDIVFARSEPNWWCAIGSWWFARMQRIPLAYHPYDVTSFRRRPEFIPRVEHIAERRMFRTANALIHKIDDQDDGVFGEVFPRTPSHRLQFLPYIPANSIPTRVATHEIHSPARLVYLGGIVFPGEKNQDPDCTHDKQARIVGEAGAELHLYPPPFNREAKDVLEQLQEMATHIPALVPHAGQKPSASFLEDISQYDFGWYVFYSNHDVVTPNSPRTAFGAKVFMYLAAGLPIITCSYLQFVASFVREHGVGLVLDELTPAELREKLRQANYQQLRENVERMRDVISSEANIRRLTTLFSDLTT